VPRSTQRNWRERPSATLLSVDCDQTGRNSHNQVRRQL
jgi:hypothetical protein